MVLQRVLLVGYLLILFVAPLPFGSVVPWARTSLATACFLLAALWIVWRSHRGLPVLPWKDPLLLAGGLFMLFGLAQTVPLPSPVLRDVSPRAAELRAQYEPTTSPEDRQRPVSLYPWATRRAPLWFVACLLAALMAIGLCALRRARLVLADGL